MPSHSILRKKSRLDPFVKAWAKKRNAYNEHSDPVSFTPTVAGERTTLFWEWKVNGQKKIASPSKIPAHFLRTIVPHQA